MKCKLILAMLASLMLTGCAVSRGSSAFRTVLNPNCLTAPIVMQDCDYSTGAAHCRVVKLSYRKGCEQIQVKSLKAPGQ
jgi:uncharacterized protein YcfL